MDSNVPIWLTVEFDRKKAELEAEGHKDSDHTTEGEILRMTPEEFWEYEFDKEPNNPNNYTEAYVSNFNYNVPKEVSNLFIIKKNQINMMRTRGFDVSEEEYILDMSVDDFNDLLYDFSTGRQTSFWSPILSGNKFSREDRDTLSEGRAFLSNQYQKDDTWSIVYYIDRPGEKKYKIKKDLIQILTDWAIAGGYSDIIFVSRKGYTTSALSILSRLPPVDPRTPRGIWTFDDTELFVNPLLSVLYSPHELAPPEEASTFKKMYRFPLQISVEDPIVKFYGWRLGSVVKITRDISMMESPVDVMLVKRLVVRDNQVGLAELREKV